ncbi:IclR family transcriptional regulator [Falsiroseomonas sp.]|uniref:IclR family transcriptional regulator n=1 Tax=Falsiroseomonas sp. TaxID=2870721 RepID=UPI003F726E62
MSATLDEGPPAAAERASGRGEGSISRAFDILDLFGDEVPLIRAEDVMERLGYRKSTAYRYLKILCDVGLVAQAGRSLYTLGPRIVELERLMVRTDPLLGAAQQEMPRLAAINGNSVVLLSSLYRDRVLCLHREGPEEINVAGEVVRLRRTRGTPLPLFHGAASLAILAMLTPHRIRSLYLERGAEIARSRLAENWQSFRRELLGMRRDGHVVTIGRYHPLLAAVAVPILPREEGEVRASLTWTLAIADLPDGEPATIINELKAAAARITTHLP